MKDIDVLLRCTVILEGFWSFRLPVDMPGSFPSDYLITSVKQRLSSEANNRSGSLEVPRIYGPLRFITVFTKVNHISVQSQVYLIPIF